MNKFYKKIYFSKDYYCQIYDNGNKAFRFGLEYFRKNGPAFISDEYKFHEKFDNLNEPYRLEGPLNVLNKNKFYFHFFGTKPEEWSYSNKYKDKLKSEEEYWNE